MKRIFNKAKDYEGAEEWDIQQQVKMSPEERQLISKELKKKAYGNNSPDVRDNRNPPEGSGKVVRSDVRTSLRRRK